MIETDFEYFIGDTYERNFKISQYSDDIDEIYFSIKKNDDNKNTVLQKTLDNGITLVTDEVNDGVRERVYQLMINADDTEELKPEQDYTFDIEIVTNKDDVNLKKTIVKGNFTLRSATTRLWNE